MKFYFYYSDIGLYLPHHFDTTEEANLAPSCSYISSYHKVIDSFLSPYVDHFLSVSKDHKELPINLWFWLQGFLPAENRNDILSCFGVCISKFESQAKV